MTTRRLGGLAAILALGATLLAGAAGSAASPADVSADHWGWAVFRNPSTSATLTGKDGATRNGGAVTVNRSKVGLYEVTFAGEGTGAGTVSVSPIGTKPRYCSILGWGGTPDVDISVACFLRNGTRTDTPFAITWLSLGAPTSSPSVAYLWAEEAALTSYTPYFVYNYNGMSGANTIHRESTGTYTARLEDMGYIGGQAYATAYGQKAWCQATGWSVIDDPAGPDEEQVKVKCRDFSGNAVDSLFALTFLNNQGPKGTQGPVAYARATKPRVAAYHPAPALQYSSPGVQWTFSRAAKGVYTARIVDAPLGGVALVNATTATPNRCQLSSIAKTGGVQKVGVRCFEPDGSPVDAPYVVTHTR
ncbi:MAG: hypothetical protein U0869_04520 [Chloroflexota bacterium]